MKKKADNLSLFLSLSVSLSLFLSLSVSLSLFLSLCFSISVSLFLFLSLFLYFCFSISVSLFQFLYFCFSISVSLFLIFSHTNRSRFDFVSWVSILNALMCISIPPSRLPQPYRSNVSGRLSVIKRTSS
jgi:hypothetical protein